MSDSHRQSGRSHKQILDALEKLTATSASSVHYVIPNGQALRYYFDMALGILKDKQKMRPELSFRGSPSTMIVAFKWSLDEPNKFLFFKHEKLADSQALHPDTIVMDHSFYVF